MNRPMMHLSRILQIWWRRHFSWAFVQNAE